MKPVRTAITAALIAAFAATAVVQAQTPPAAPAATTASGAPASKRADLRERYAKRHQERMAELKKQLQITAAQEGAWSQFSNAMNPPATRPQRPDREAMARLTTPERIDQMRSMRAQRMAEMDKRADATKAFYATLSPEQKKRFDELTSRPMAKHMGPSGSHDGHRGGHHGHHG